MRQTLAERAGCWRGTGGDCDSSARPVIGFELCQPPLDFCQLGLRVAPDNQLTQSGTGTNEIALDGSRLNANAQPRILEWLIGGSLNPRGWRTKVAQTAFGEVCLPAVKGRKD